MINSVIIDTKIQCQSKKKWMSLMNINKFLRYLFSVHFKSLIHNRITIVTSRGSKNFVLLIYKHIEFVNV